MFISTFSQCQHLAYGDVPLRGQPLCTIIRAPRLWASRGGNNISGDAETATNHWMLLPFNQGLSPTESFSEC